MHATFVRTNRGFLKSSPSSKSRSQPRAFADPPLVTADNTAHNRAVQVASRADPLIIVVRSLFYLIFRNMGPEGAIAFPFQAYSEILQRLLQCCVYSIRRFLIRTVFLLAKLSSAYITPVSCRRP